MKAPAFWQTRPPSALARLLQPLGRIYGAATLARMRRAGETLDVPVVCVGNFTAGGAGKTPTAIALAEALKARGERPAFLTRGYGGGARSPLIVDAERHVSALVGDEALLLARAAPTIVSADRAAGARLALTLTPSVLIMDDGMQNPSLAKDFVLAVVDGGAGFGNGLCLPAGPLRAPAEAQAGMVQALLAIGAGPGFAEAEALARRAGKPLFRAALTVDPDIADRIAGRKLLAFAGIGRPQKFFETLTGVYARIGAARVFADHHAYVDADARSLIEAARAGGLTLATTEKDWVRLKGSPALEALAAQSIAVPVRLSSAEPLIDAAAAAISRARGATG